jgi:DNA-directed RNA polymerase subunit RPC12/RpoP
MRILTYISIGVAAIGLAAYYYMGETAPVFILPLILISGTAAVLFLLTSLGARLFQGRKKYQCLNCGTVLRGSDPVRLGNVCPNCGGNTFR